MMFILAEKEPVLFLCLLTEDEMKLRNGHTLFVDPRMTGGRSFNQVVVSLHKTKDDVVAMLRSVQPGAKIPDHLPEPPPREGEVACSGCGASNRPEMLFEARCLLCWANEAKRFRAQSN